MPNLAVFIGAGFASLGGYNPTRTIQACSGFAAEYIAANFDAITS